MAPENVQKVPDNIDDILKYRSDVVRMIYPELKDISNEEINPAGIEIMEGIGNPASNHYLVRHNVKGRDYHFNARYHGKPSPTYSGPQDRARVASRAYNFLRDDAQIQEVPSAAFLESYPEWIFLEHIPGQTLGEIMKDLKKDQAGELILNLAKEIAALQYKATKATRKLPEADKKNIFWARSLEEQVENYYKDIVEKETGLNDFMAAYNLLIINSLKGDEACHGELSQDNIIRHAVNNKFYFIDPELKERNEFADLGSLLSYLGNYEDYWDRLAIGSPEEKVRLYMEEKGVEPKGIFKGVKPTEGGRPEVIKNLYSNILHYSLRQISKARTRVKRPYEAQARNVFAVLNAFSNQDKFGLSPQQKDAAKLIKDSLSCLNGKGEETRVISIPEEAASAK